MAKTSKNKAAKTSKKDNPADTSDTSDAMAALAAEEAERLNPTPEPKAEPKKGKKEEMVKVFNKGEHPYEHAEHGKLLPGQLGEFPASYAATLIRLGQGKILTEDMAKAEFQASNKKEAAPAAGSEAIVNMPTGHDAFKNA